jgi:hypothetical protein
VERRRRGELDPKNAGKSPKASCPVTSVAQNNPTKRCRKTDRSSGYRQSLEKLHADQP